MLICLHIHILNLEHAGCFRRQLNILKRVSLKNRVHFLDLQRAGFFPKSFFMVIME